MAGSIEQLARYLKVTPSHLCLWIDGVGSPPTDVFLKAVDLITDTEVLSLTRERK